MRYNCLLLFLSFILTTSYTTIKGQEEKYKIQVNIPEQGNSMAYLAKYWNGEPYAIDSVQLSKEGKGIIQSEGLLESGQYLLYVKPSLQLDLLIDEGQNNIDIYIDQKNFGKSTVSGSKDTELLWEYLVKTDKEKKEKEELNKKLKNNKLSEKKRIEYHSHIEKIDAEIDALTKEAVDKNKGTWFASFIQATDRRVNIPYLDPQSREEAEANRLYAKEHTFDRIDLQDPKIWNTAFLPVFLNDYLTQTIENNPDSMAVAAGRLVAQSEANPICFEKMLSYFINTYSQNKVMGNENIWARLYEDYILDKELDWITSTQQTNLRAEYEKIKNNRIGNKAHSLLLTDINGTTIDTNNFDKDFTILYFYSTNCGHCLHETPVIHDEIYPKFKDKIAFIAINIDPNVEAWHKFVEKNKLMDWTNCSDPEYKSEYWMYYDISGVPSTFLMDKDKTIIAKKLDKDNLEKVLEYYIKD